MKSSSNIEIGYVARAHGVAGELRIHTHDPASQTLLSAEVVYLDGERFAVARARRAHGAFLVRLEGVSDRNRAAELRGRKVAVDRDAIDLDDGDVLLVDLVGCRVERTDGSAWGQVVRVDVGAQDRLIIHDGGVERMVPLVDALVIDVDIDARRVVVDIPEEWPEAEL